MFIFLFVIVTLSSSGLEEDGLEEPLSYRRQRNKKAEEELHHISENLSHRLEELDQVCVCVCVCVCFFFIYIYIFFLF